ncbi:MAG: ATPase, partial [Candidatus Aegiribacteria sp.]|nr:ATPase [Candidatus Aegiribacteria sp.]MBD3294012.1 ATPase [Candidatus Fermentibacteria bacterium]
MKLLRQVKGQERAERLLSGSFSSGRLSHAHLFAGPSGVGRLSAALELSAAWMCRESEESYCGDCRDCRRVMSFQHPDVRLTIPV